MKIILLEPLEVKTCRYLEMHDKLKALGHEFAFYPDKATTTQELIDRATDADIIITGSTPLNAEFIAACTKLKYIAVAFSGFNHIDLVQCKKQGIAVSNAPGYSTHAVAELVFGLVFNLYRNLSENEAKLRTGTDRKGDLGFTLAGKTFGILGAGQIGTQAAKIALAFGCNVLAFSRTPKDIPGVTWTDKNTVLRKSDIVSLHLPLNNETANLIGFDEVRMMKESAILINTARGGLVNSEALAFALNNYLITGAGIDVYETEPPLNLNHPLLSAKNCLLLPHIGYATREAMEKRWQISMGNVFSFLKGEPENLVS
ncbi:MAG TPA: hydroxyacid dehydrogenase [Bacteroidales bacterium]|nr:hydroxyacid dehydrogenase [Bacteroidales bacterium]